MTPNRNRLFLACAIALVFGIPTFAQHKTETYQFAGTYHAGFQFGGSSITLGSDGTFRNDSGSCTFTTQESGKYVFSNGVLRFTINKYTGKQNFDGKEVDLLDVKSRRKFFQYPADVKDDVPLKTEFVLYPIKWGERTYLIYEDDLANFTNAINLSLEPREPGLQLNYYGLFFLREGDEEKTAKGKPSLPSKWKDLLLGEPITATIVSVEAGEVGKEQVATIDRGRADGVKIGMKFIASEQDPEFWSNNGIVLSVEAQSARVQVYHRLVGEILTTKFVRKDRYR